ncbi:hypothetical protein [Nocardioides sp. P5_E3]
MTGLLNDLMRDRADHLEAPEVDLAAIARDGERVVRRRRAALVGGVAAASVVAVVSGAALLGTRGGDDGQVAGSPPAAVQPLTWTTGRTLHTAGGESVDLAAEVRAWVWVGDDVVYTDPGHRVHLWQDGRDRVVGETMAPDTDLAELVSDGTFVAWVGADRRVERYDVSDGATVRGPALPGERPRVTAIDGAEVYLADSAGVYAWQPSTPSSYRTIDTDPRAVVLDAESGTLVRTAPGRTVLLEREGTTLHVSAREFADLSPDAGLLSLDDADIGKVVDTTTGRGVTLDHGHEWAVGYQWLDPTTVATLAFDGMDDEASMDGWLLTCDALTGACAPGEHLPALGEFQLPAGLHFAAP